jgi:threonine/homoserine/homoserine lactone efflux protein
LTEDLITISIIGLVAGFIFSMPIAGPISILVTSNALKGKLKYCNLLAIGASLADFIYVLLAVYGVTHLFTEFKGIIPYILGMGALFVLYVGIKIIRTKFDPYHIDEEQRLADEQEKKHRGAFYTGFMINFLNPTLFFGWLVSSFITLSFASALGFNTGGLATAVDENFEQIQKIGRSNIEKPGIPSYLQFDTLNMLKKENHPVKLVKYPVYFHLLASLLYSAFLSVGAILWFLLLALLLVRFRKRISIGFINLLVRGFGIVLCLIAVYFGFTALKMLI